MSAGPEVLSEGLAFPVIQEVLKSVTLQLLSPIRHLGKGTKQFKSFSFILEFRIDKVKYFKN